MLDPRQLEALAAVIEQGSFRGASQALHLTLAAVSLRVKGLEEALGRRLLVRGKRVRATPGGQALLAYVKQVRLMEADLIGHLQGDAEGRKPAWQSLSAAVNADSVATWFLPGVTTLLRRHRILLDVVIDDQDHTHDALRSGEVMGCVTTLAHPIRGCLAEPLGTMRYRCVATPELVEKCRTPTGKVSTHRLLAQPAIIFNRKDGLQEAFLQQHFGLEQANYPRHFFPAVNAFEKAIELGLGWGMVPEQHLREHGGTLAAEEILPGATVDVQLYWQHWAREPLPAQRLTQAVKAAASQLHPLAA